MRRSVAAAGSTLFFVLAPGGVAVLAPWLLTRWQVLPFPLAARLAGIALIVAGAPVLVHAFARFVVEGAGTPAPVAPTEHLVVGGLYRYVRNPMYVAVCSLIVGQALALGQTRLLAYAAVVAAAFALFVRLYEEPTLQTRYGAEYEAYRRGVRAWIPRLTPWKP